MATLRWAEICDLVIIDAYKKVSVIGIYDQINTKGFPAVIPVFWFICRMDGAPGEKVRLEVSLVGPDGENMGPVGVFETVTSAPGGAFVAAQITGTTFPKPGRYELRIRPSGNPIHSLYLNVLPVQEPHQER